MRIVNGGRTKKQFVVGGKDGGVVEEGAWSGGGRILTKGVTAVAIGDVVLFGCRRFFCVMFGRRGVLLPVV